jgi:multicomponent Na+:H+ antiporter subunit E
MTSFVLNLIIAIMWLFLSREQTMVSLLIGFLIGFGLLALFAPVLGSGDYVRRGVALVRFLLVFFREFILSNLAIAKAILTRPRESIRPNFVTYDVSDMRRMEILLLTHCITLTPGTTTVEVSKDFKTILIHCFDVEDAEAVRRQIERRLKRNILRFTR